jgi:PAS domain S-box-containing protein
LVEDNPGDADLVLEYLGVQPGASEQVAHVKTLAEALRALSAEDTDIVLLDLGLPDASGVECVAAIRAKAGDIPIVVLTGTDDEAVALACIAAGAQDYLSKLEFRSQSLGRALAYAIARRQEASQRQRADELQRRLAAIVEASSDAIVSSTPSGAITSWNRGAALIFGYEPGEVIGKPIGEVLRPAAGAGPTEQEDRILPTPQQDDTAGAGEIVVLRKDGQPVTLSVVSSTLRDENGAVVGRAAICRDVTDWRRLEQQFLQSQKMEAVGQLAGGVAHDFNNLLGVITGHTELLLRDLGSEGRARSRLEEVRKAAEHAASLTRQLLAFSRKQVLRPRIVDLNEVVASVERLLRRLIGEDIRLVAALGARLWRVKVDPGQIEQVIVNLAVNARDAMSAGGRLVIETSNTSLDESYTRGRPGLDPGDYVLLAVSDTGHGMDAATAAQIFEPFFTTKEPGKGTGLGLATVYGIIKQSGGHIAVYSEPRIGTTFKIYFPRAEGVEERAPEGPQEPPPRGRETVLLLEDAEALQMIVREILEDAGYTVIDGKTTEDALARAAEHRGAIDIVLTDVIMPGASGPEVVARIKTEWPEIRVLFMSGYADPAIGRRGTLEPNTNFIQKPFTAEALQRKLREVLDRARDPGKGEP